MKKSRHSLTSTDEIAIKNAYDEDAHLDVIYQAVGERETIHHFSHCEFFNLWKSPVDLSINMTFIINARRNRI